MNMSRLLREIADVLDKDTTHGYEEFDIRPLSSKDTWRRAQNWADVLRGIEKSAVEIAIRHRPRTIKVSGEVSEEVVEIARSLSDAKSTCQISIDDLDILVKTILDLIEQSGGE